MSEVRLPGQPVAVPPFVLWPAWAIAERRSCAHGASDGGGPSSTKRDCMAMVTDSHSPASATGVQTDEIGRSPKACSTMLITSSRWLST